MLIENLWGGEGGGDGSGKFYDFVPWSFFYANPPLIKTYVLPFAVALTQPSCYFPLHEI